MYVYVSMLSLSLSSISSRRVARVEDQIFAYWSIIVDEDIRHLLPLSDAQCVDALYTSVHRSSI